MNITIYNEFIHEKNEQRIADVYPKGIHEQLKSFIESDENKVTCITLDNIATDMTDELINSTDVMIWWGHMGHHLVPDEIAVKVQNAVLSGMGIIFLHSAHHSKPFKLLMGTPCNLGWREDKDYERLWVCNPAHPIAKGIGRCITLAHVEVYSEPFMIPEPDELVFIGAYEGGEAMRSGCCYKRGYGKVFYFQPGHESFPTYYNKDIQTVILNAIEWAKPNYRGILGCPHIDPLPPVER